jgi:hypothetical protein
MHTFSGAEQHVVEVWACAMATVDMRDGWTAASSRLDRGPDPRARRDRADARLDGVPRSYTLMARDPHP